MRFIINLLRDSRAAAAAEFALVVPLLIVFLLGVIDVGRLMWTWNQAEKATQMGVRFAIVTDTVPLDLRDNFVTEYGLPGGDPVPTSTFSTTTCNTTTCSGGWGYDAAAFDKIVQRMNFIFPQVGDANVTVRYDNVGLGFAGDPSGPDVAALVTVSLQNITFRPIFLFGAVNFTLPPFSAALTMEDGTGTVSN